MKVCFVSSGRVADYVVSDFENAEIIVFGFGAIDKLNYKRELKGETEELVKIGRLSKDTGAIVICGTETDNYGVKKLSCVIADRGKIIGIADMNAKSENGEYSSGGGFKILSTAIGKIGILVGDDIYSPEAVKSMSMCETDLIIALYKDLSDYKHNVVMRAFSLIYGVPMCMVARGYSFATNILGETLFSSPERILTYDIQTKKVYKEITTRQRGISLQHS